MALSYFLLFNLLNDTKKVGDIDLLLELMEEPKDETNGLSRGIGRAVLVGDLHNGRRRNRDARLHGSG